MNEEREMKNSINKFELEGNVGNIRDIYINKNGKSSLRFDLGQNNNGNTQFVPIVIKGALVDTYGKEIEKGNWISVKGRISAFSKDVEKDGKTFKEKSVEILGFEITDRTNNKIYTSDGQIQDISNSKDEMER
ncbi:MAG: single-stranded DNA-binding protein [Clostridia bacterium]|nr:single-stranded DNA-binding protein [Clostridia bacterium]